VPSFVEVGDRVRWVSERKFRQEDWPPDVWMEKGVEGTVTKVYSEETEPEYSPEEREWYTIPPAAVVKWDNGAECLIHKGEDTPILGQVWEKIGKRYERMPTPALLSHDLWMLTMSELKQKCREQGLPDSGNKGDLIRRLTK